MVRGCQVRDLYALGPASVPGVAPPGMPAGSTSRVARATGTTGATYGHPSKFGYKDICKLFKAPKFDQAQPIASSRSTSGSVPAMSFRSRCSHDNFDMWDSKYQPRFNSVAMSGKDVVGMWKKAADKHGLHLGVASHCGAKLPLFQPRRLRPSGPLAESLRRPEPGYADLYGVNGTTPASGTSK